MSKSCMALVRLVLPFHAAAWKASSEPIQALLNTTDTKKQDALTGVWRDTTQSQLNAIGITVMTQTPYPRFINSFALYFLPFNS